MNKWSGFHLINVVWGESFTKLFLDVCLPTQLSPRNLGAFRNEKNAVYRIYTTAKDAETIIKHPVYSVLSKTIRTKIKIFDLDSLKGTKHEVMNWCHQHAVIQANKDNCILIFLLPDGAFADGLFEKLISLAYAGKRTVMIGTFRVVKETFIPDLITLFNPEKKPTISISNRLLVSLSLEHLHPINKAQFWEDDGCRSFHPAMLYWRVANEGMVAKYFHTQPIMIYPLNKNVLPSPTIDGKYVSLACPEPEDIYVVQDSDDMYYCEFSSADIYQDHIRHQGVTNIEDMAHWVHRMTDSFHRYCFKNYKLLTHVGEISPLWAKAHAESDIVGEQIFAEFELRYKGESVY